MPQQSFTDVSPLDAIVVGAGAIGAAAAYHLALRGRRILLLEQFQIGNKRGSSHGESRIIRYAHDDADFARFMPQTFELWRRLEHESGATLLKDAGTLFVGQPDSAYLNRCCAALDALAFPYELLAGADLAAAHPQFRLPEDWIGLYQSHGGILSATRCVQALAAEAVKRGAVLRENTRVEAITPTDDGVEVRTTSHGEETAYRAAQVIVAAGPWAPAFYAS